MLKTRTLILGFLMLPVLTSAQSVLTLKEVIDSTLLNSFDIRIAENNLLISQKMNTYGMAGGLPYLAASATGNGAVNDLYQSFPDGPDSRLNGVTQMSSHAGAEMGITLFNGFKVMAAKERLALLEKQNEYLLNYEIQNAMATAMIRYYDVVRQRAYLKILEQQKEVSEKKLEIIHVKKEAGLASNVILMQAQMDVDIAAENVQQQKLIVDHAKHDLRLAMCSKSDFDFVISDTITLNHFISKDSLIQSIKNNPLYLSVIQQTRIRQQMAKESSANLYPALKLGAAYDYSINSSSAGSVIHSVVNGPSAAISLQIPLYYGGSYRVQYEAAKISVMNAQMAEESTKLLLETTALKLYQTYQKNLELIEEQKKSYERAKELVDLVLLNFRLNHATILEVKAAQTTLENSGYMLVNMLYSAKSAEIQMLALMLRLK